VVGIRDTSLSHELVVGIRDTSLSHELVVGIRDTSLYHKLVVGIRNTSLCHELVACIHGVFCPSAMSVYFSEIFLYLLLYTKEQKVSLFSNGNSIHILVINL
jgi:hypothetical protein